MTSPSPDTLEHQIAALIAEHVTIGYELGPDGRVNPDTIFVAGTLGAAHVVIHALRGKL